MAPPVITVTRQYGSGGSDIARLVAERLGWELVDNQFVEAVARRAGVPPDEGAQREERAPGLLERLARTLAGAPPEMFIAPAPRPRVGQEEAPLGEGTPGGIAGAGMHGPGVLLSPRGEAAGLKKRGNGEGGTRNSDPPRFRVPLSDSRVRSPAAPAPSPLPPPRPAHCRAPPPPRRSERRRARRTPPPGTRPAAPCRRTRRSRTPSPDRAAGRGRASATWCS